MIVIFPDLNNTKDNINSTGSRTIKTAQLNRLATTLAVDRLLTGPTSGQLLYYSSAKHHASFRLSQATADSLHRFGLPRLSLRQPTPVPGATSG